MTCDTCEDVRVVMLSTTDPESIAKRLGMTCCALARHLYRCGQPELARLVARPATAQRYARRMSA